MFSCGRGMQIDGEVLRSVMRRVPSPVVVVTARGDREVRGITIGSFTSVSLDPPLICFNVSHGSQMHAVITSAGHFNVHFIGDARATLCNHFAAADLSGAEQFAAVDHFEDLHGVPVLKEASAVLQCSPRHLYEAGDHTIVVGQVEEVGILNERESPVIYFDRNYRSVGSVVCSRTDLPPTPTASGVELTAAPKNAKS